MAQNLKTLRFQGEFTRQTDITPYAAQDVVGPTSSGTTALTLTPLNADGTVSDNIKLAGSYQVKSVKLTKSTNSTTNASFDVYLYSSGVVMTYQDNQQFGLAYGNKHVRHGKVSLTMATGGATNSDCSEAVATDVNLLIKAASGTLSYTVVATAAYTPGVSEKFYLEVELVEINA